MRLEWLEDILAVIETGSFNSAAERRYLTQPAFSRRLRAIEAYVGVELFDRSRKPAQLKPELIGQHDRMRELADGLSELLDELRQRDRATRNRIVIASQHAITTSTAPAIVDRLSSDNLQIRLRSANRDECFAHLITKRADLTLVYSIAEEGTLPHEEFLDRRVVGAERLVPVFATAALDRLNETYARGSLPVVAYPRDVFLGALQSQHLFPRLRGAVALQAKVETALTLAALQFARNGFGVAWVPASLAADDVARGTLTELGGTLPVQSLTIVALRQRGRQSPAIERVWRLIEAGLGPIVDPGAQTA